MQRAAAATPGYVRAIARANGGEIFSAQELQAVQHNSSTLAMQERWVGGSQRLVLSVAVGHVQTDDDDTPEVLIVATGHTSGEIMLRQVGDDDDDDEPFTLDLGRGARGGAVRSLAMDGCILASGSESGAVRLFGVSYSFGHVQRIRCALLARMLCNGEAEAVCMIASARRLGAGVSGVGDAGGGLRVWDVELPLAFPDDETACLDCDDIDDIDAADEADAADAAEERTGRTGCDGMRDISPDAAELGIGDVYALAMSADGRQLVAGGADGGVWLWAWEDAAGGVPTLIWRGKRDGAIQALSLCAAGLVIAASDHKPPGQAAAGTAALLLRTSVDGHTWEVDLPNSKSPNCKDMVCDGGVQQEPQVATLGQGLWNGQWSTPVAATSCPVCSTAFPVVLATALVDAPDGSTTLLFGGYGRQIERWDGVFEFVARGDGVDGRDLE